MVKHTKEQTKQKQTKKVSITPGVHHVNEIDNQKDRNLESERITPIEIYAGTIQ